MYPILLLERQEPLGPQAATYVHAVWLGLGLGSGLELGRGR